MRTLSSEYLKLRFAAFQSEDQLPDDEMMPLFWQAFMAGSDWERRFRGLRYADETTGVAPHMDLTA